MAPHIPAFGLVMFCLLDSLLGLAPSDQLGYIISYKDDQLQLPISQLFNLTSSTKYPTCTLQAGNPGQLCDSQTCKVQNPLTSGVTGQLVFTKQVSASRLMGVVADGTTLSLLTVTLGTDGMSVSESKSIPFSQELPGEGTFLCRDIEFDRASSQVYVACKAGDDASIYIVTINIKQQTKPSVSQFTATDQFKISGIVRILLANFKTADGKTAPSLTVFCQSVTSAPSPASSQAWVYIWSVDADTRKVSAQGRFVDLSSSGLFTTVSVFENFGTLVISGKPQGSDMTARLQIAKCKIPAPQQNQALVCEQAQNTINENYNGYVGKTYSGIYVEAYEHGSAQQKSIVVDRCTFAGPDLKDLDCSMTSSIVYINTSIPDNSGIFSVEDSNFITIVKFFQYSEGTMNQYAGLAFSVGTQISAAGFVTPLGSTLIELTTQQVSSQLYAQPYYYLQVASVQSDSATIKITCSDSTAANVQKVISLNVLRHMGDLVMPSLFQGPPSLALEHAVQSTFTFSPKFILGNNLRAMVYPQPRQQTGQVAYKQKDFLSTNFYLDGVATTALPTKLAVAGNFGAIIDDQGMIVGLQCSVLDAFDSANYTCSRLANPSLKVATGTVFQKQWSSRTTSVFLVKTDQTPQLFIIQQTKSGDIQTSLSTLKPLSQIAVSIDSNMLITIATVSSSGNLIEVSYAGAVLVDTPAPFNITGQTINIRPEDFSPLRMQFHPLYPSQLIVWSSSADMGIGSLSTIQLHTSKAVQSTQSTLDVLSSYTVNAQVLVNSDICVLSSEIVLFDGQNTQSYSTSGAARNVWNFGTAGDDLGLGKADAFKCLQSSNAFVTRSQNTDKSQASLNIYWGNNQYLANNKVFRATACNLDSAANFEVFESPANVLLFRLSGSPDGSVKTPQLYASYTAARLISGSITLKDASLVGPGGNASMVTTFDFSNSFHQMTFSEPVALWTNISNTSVSFIPEKLKANETSEVDLISIANVTGPLAGVSITGSTANLQVLGRVWNTTGFGDGQLSAAKLFSVFKTTSGDVVAIQQYAQTNTSVVWGDTFVLSSDLQKWYTLYTPSKPITQLDMANSGGHTLGAASTESGIEAWYWDGDISKRATYQTLNLKVPGVKYSKVKVLPLNTDSFYILAFDQLTNRVDIHFATVAQTNFRLSKSGVSISDVLDFDTVVLEASNSIALYTISLADPTVLKVVSWKRAFDPPTLTQSTISVTFTKTAALSSVKVVAVNATNYYLLLDVEILPYFMELAFQSTNTTTPTAPTYYMKAYTGSTNSEQLRYAFDGTAAYVVGLPSTPGAVAPVYVRGAPGTTNKMWYGLTFGADQQMSVGNDQLATVYQLASGENKLIQLSSSATQGQKQLWVSSLKSSISLLLNNCSPAALKTSTLVVRGERGVVASAGFDTLLEVPEPPVPSKPKKSNAWVHGILISMIVLVVVAAVYAFWRRNKDNEEGGNEELFTASTDHETFRKENESVYDRVG